MRSWTWAAALSAILGIDSRVCGQEPGNLQGGYWSRPSMQRGDETAVEVQSGKGPDSRYNLKVKPIGLADGLHVRWEREASRITSRILA